MKNNNQTLSDAVNKAVAEAVNKFHTEQNDSGNSPRPTLPAGLIGYAYDPKCYKIYVDNELVYGFSADKKIDIVSTEAGVDFFIYLQAPSPFAGKFRNAIGSKIDVRAEYIPSHNMCDYGPALNYQETTIVQCVSLSAGCEVPTLVVHFSGSAYQNRQVVNATRTRSR